MAYGWKHDVDINSISYERLDFSERFPLTSDERYYLTQNTQNTRTQKRAPTRDALSSFISFAKRSKS